MMNRKNCRYVIVPAMLAMLLTASLTGCGTKEVRTPCRMRIPRR